MPNLKTMLKAVGYVLVGILGFTSFLFAIRLLVSKDIVPAIVCMLAVVLAVYILSAENKTE